MKAILNNNANKAITFSSFSRRLNLENDSIDFDISFDMSAGATTGNASALAAYAKTPISRIQIVNNADEVLIDMQDVNAALTSFNEVLTDEYYNASASLVVYAKEAAPEEEE